MVETSGDRDKTRLPVRIYDLNRPLAANVRSATRASLAMPPLPADMKP